MNDLWKQKSPEILVEHRAKYLYELLVRKELHMPSSPYHRVKIAIVISYVPILYVEHYVHSRKLFAFHILQYSFNHLPQDLTLLETQLL